MEQSSVKVRFKGCHGSGHAYWSFNPAILTKLNKFSVNQVIRIRNDERTIQSIDSKFMQLEIRKKVFLILIIKKNILFYLQLFITADWSHWQSI